MNPTIFIVTTHEDKHHIHSHIYFNSTTLDCTRKFEDFLRSGRAIRRLSDTICVEKGLSIVENPKPSKGNYGTWLGDEKPPSFQAQLRQVIDAALEQKPSDFEAFLLLMEAAAPLNRPRQKLIYSLTFRQKSRQEKALATNAGQRFST